MKKTFLSLSMATILGIGMMSGISNTFAADDFDSLLNALNTSDNSTPAVTSETTPAADTTTPVATPATTPAVDTPATTEVDLDSMYNKSATDNTPAQVAVETPVQGTDASIQTEPTTANTGNGGFVESILGAPTYSDEVNGTESKVEVEPVNTNTVDQGANLGTDTGKGGQKLTATGAQDYIYLIILLGLISSIAFVRFRKKA